MMGYVFLICMSQVVGEWPTWGGDLTHRAVQGLRGAMTTPVVKWGFATGSWVEHEFSAIADVDNDGNTEIVLGSGDGNIYCLTGSDGTQKWSFTTGNSVSCSPAVADVDGDGGLEVVVASADYSIYCLNGSNGSQKWSFATGNIIWSSPAVADVDGDGNMEVVVASTDCNVYCLNGSDGSQKWIFTTGGSITSSPAVADVDGDGSLEVVIGSDDDSVHCIAGLDGSQKWAFRTGNNVYSSPAIADLDYDGNLEVVVGSDDGNIYCIAGPDGTQKWIVGTGTRVQASPAIADVDGDGSLEIIVGAGDNNVHCLSGLDGSQEWVFPTSSSMMDPGALVDVDGDNKLEFLVPQNNDTSLLCLNTEDGSLLWEIKLAFDVHSPFAGDVDGDDCVEIVAGTQEANAQGYRVFVLDDPTDSAYCGPLYSGVGEDSRSLSLDLMVMGRGLYLFAPNQTQISLELYDASGRLVQNLFNGVISPGGHTFVPTVESKGVYIAVLTYQGGTKSLKIAR